MSAKTVTAILLASIVTILSLAGLIHIRQSKAEAFALIRHELERRLGSPVPDPDRHRPLPVLLADVIEPGMPRLRVDQLVFGYDAVITKLDTGDTWSEEYRFEGEVNQSLFILYNKDDKVVQDELMKL